MEGRGWEGEGEREEGGEKKTRFIAQAYLLVQQLGLVSAFLQVSRPGKVGEKEGKEGKGKKEGAIPELIALFLRRGNSPLGSSAIRRASGGGEEEKRDRKRGGGEKKRGKGGRRPHQ